jgi:general secretion pathway protein I
VKHPRGFTLIEIVVALAVLAFAMGAIISGMARYAANAAYLRDKTLALYVAHNRLAEVNLETAFPAIGDSDGDAEMGGAKWRWSEKVSDTPDPMVRRVEVRVRIQGTSDDIATLTGFITKL